MDNTEQLTATVIARVTPTEKKIVVDYAEKYDVEQSVAIRKGIKILGVLEDETS